ncbi:hypothetical protein Plhal304r1_c047g0129311 [Plasmopara halstedii]
MNVWTPLWQNCPSLFVSLSAFVRLSLMTWRIFGSFLHGCVLQPAMSRSYFAP